MLSNAVESINKGMRLYNPIGIDNSERMLAWCGMHDALIQMQDARCSLRIQHNANDLPKCVR